MKRNILILFFSLFFLKGYCTFSDPNLFILDEGSLDIEFVELNKLEKYVEQNQGITLSELLKYNNHIISFLPDLSSNTPPSMDNMFTLEQKVLGCVIESLCCCLIGGAIMFN